MLQIHKESDARLLAILLALTLHKPYVRVAGESGRVEDAELSIYLFPQFRGPKMDPERL